jgi:prepilin-type N-terminal cleavage/methylation domain-containing protein
MSVSVYQRRWFAARRSQGLTLLEVILALAVLAIIGAVFTTAVLRNLRHTTTAGTRTQAAQVLNYFGRRIVGGDSALQPASGDTLSWGYEQLAAAFPDIGGATGMADVDRYRVDVSAVGTSTVAGATLQQYDVLVCFEAPDGESCVTGTTLSSSASSTGSTPPLPGVN